MTKNKLSKLIEKSQEHFDEEPRNYIGASSIGSECLRQIWYQYKGYIPFGIPSNTRRTWAIGKHLEQLILDWIEKTGVTVVRLWWDLSSKTVSNFKGHVDAIWTKNDTPYAILEIKTAKNSSFTIFVNKGLKIWNPQYYAQIQSYMGMSGIFSAYILVLNKDNSALSDEFVAFDEEYYNSLEEKALMISNSTIEPPRISSSPLWFKCKMCSFNKVCHK